MMARVKWILAAALPVLGACSISEPDWRNAESGTESWKVPVPDYEHTVSPPLDYEDLREYADRMMKGGWEVSEIQPAGPELPARYIVVCRRLQ